MFKKLYSPIYWGTWSLLLWDQTRRDLNQIVSTSLNAFPQQCPQMGHVPLSNISLSWFSCLLKGFCRVWGRCLLCFPKQICFVLMVDIRFDTRGKDSALPRLWINISLYFMAYFYLPFHDITQVEGLKWRGEMRKFPLIWKSMRESTAMPRNGWD